MVPAWTPDLRFAGQTVFVVGGGPSLRDVDLRRLRGHRVAVCNQMGHALPWADLLFFNDFAWWERPSNAALCARWGQLVCTQSHRAAEIAGIPSGIRRVAYEYRDDFPPPGSPVCRFGTSSGHKTVSLVLCMGATRIVLLGMDCRMIGGRSHAHDAYSHRDESGAMRTWLEGPRGWRGWGASASERGGAIVNASAISALREFPIVDLDEELARDAGGTRRPT